jgi:hypothetical protein
LCIYIAMNIFWRLCCKYILRWHWLTIVVIEFVFFRWHWSLPDYQQVTIIYGFKRLHYMVSKDFTKSFWVWDATIARFRGYYFQFGSVFIKKKTKPKPVQTSLARFFGLARFFPVWLLFFGLARFFRFGFGSFFLVSGL